MRGIVVLLLAMVSMLLMCASAYAAGANLAGFHIGSIADWVPFLGSSLSGVLLVLVTMVPTLRKVGSLFTEAVIELNIFMAKYSGLLQGEVRADLMKVLSKFDVAFDLLAVIMGRFGAKKLSNFLSDVIKSEWFQQKSTPK